MAFNFRMKTACIMALLVVGVGACGSPASMSNTASVDSQTQVKERVAARWNAMIAGDLDRAYRYLSPGYRDSVSPELFKKRVTPLGWKAITVDEVNCEVAQCQVGVTLEYSFAGLNSVKTRLNETWIREAGNWWLFLRQ